MSKTIVWHGSDNGTIKLFYALSHFGTLDSALARVENKDETFFYKCEIDTTGYIGIQDFGNEMELFAHDLYIQKILTKEEYMLLTPTVYKNDISTWRSKFKNILLSKNINGFRYVNVAEAAGDTSYIVVNPRTIDIKLTYINPPILK